MPTYIGFLRAVNVGKRQMRMERLRDVLSANGFDDVETHIASGNVRVSTPMRSAAKVEERLRELISEEFGFDVPVVVRTPAQLRKVAETAETIDSPVAADAKRYVTFLTGSISKAGTEALHGWEVETEGARVHGNDVVLFLAAGVQGSKLSNDRIEKLTGATGTARAITVVRALADKWGG